MASNGLEWGGEVDGMDGTAVDGREVAVVVWSDAGQGPSCGPDGSSDAASDGESVPVAERSNQAGVEAGISKRWDLGLTADKGASSTRHCDVQGQLNDSDSTGCRMIAWISRRLDDTRPAMDGR